MKLDHFNNLTDDEKAAYLLGAESLEATIKDHEAEIASYKTENETMKAGLEKLEKELKETKELNFTLARKVDTGKDRPSFEDTLHEMFYPNKRGEK